MWKIVFTMLFMAIAECFSLNPEADFTRFVGSIGDSASPKEIKRKIQNGTDLSRDVKEVAENFLKNFGCCFDGEPAPKPSPVISGVLYDIARQLGIRFLYQSQRSGQENEIKAALAFLRSVPEVTYSSSGADIIDMDYIKAAEEEEEFIRNKNETIKKLQSFVLPDLD